MTAAVLIFWGSAARADDFDSLINLELAFRDTIFDEPAPRRYQPLLRDGETTITFVRELPATTGKTDFFLNLDWKYDYRYATQTIDGFTQVSVTATKIRLTPRVRHVIRLPLAFYRNDVWESQLLGHEFDHVAVSLDPRARAMLIHLCRRLPTYRFSIDAAEKPSDKQMRAGVDREIRRRQSAILDLLRANYVALDKISRHGRVVMQDRNRFFESLYTRTNLETVGFPYVHEAASLLDSDTFRQLRPRHVTVDPVAIPQQ